MSNLATLLDDSAHRHPDRTAIVIGDVRVTYDELHRSANQIANLLNERGVGHGDKVALSCPNLPQFTAAYFGILKAGAVVVPLNVLLKRREIAYHLNDAEAKAYIAFQGTAELPIGLEAQAAFTEVDTCEHFFIVNADPAAPSSDSGTEPLAQALADQPSTYDTVEVDEEDTAVILYTSGTTGQPKGAELRHRNMLSNALAGRDVFGVDTDRPDTYLCVLPLFHSFGQTVIQNGAVALGGTLVMLPRFDADLALTLMQAERVTFFAGVPTMYWGLLGALSGSGVDIAKIAADLRVAVAGGSALPVEVHKQFAERFGVTILEGYGLSETSPVASFSQYGGAARVGSIGVPIPGVEMKLLEPDTWNDLSDPEGVGEIAIKGENVMKGYHGRPEATAEAISPDGWFRSGDLARKDADGWYYIVDRAKDMIIRGGFNVYPREIEQVLLAHPAVSLAAVIGVPYESHGEEIKAFVILKPGATTSSNEIIEWSKEQMAAYKYPRVVEIVQDLPMTATGKILKRDLT